LPKRPVTHPSNGLTKEKLQQNAVVFRGKPRVETEMLLKPTQEVFKILKERLDNQTGNPLKRVVEQCQTLRQLSDALPLIQDELKQWTHKQMRARKHDRSRFPIDRSKWVNEAQYNQKFEPYDPDMPTYKYNKDPSLFQKLDCLDEYTKLH